MGEVRVLAQVGEVAPAEPDRLPERGERLVGLAQIRVAAGEIVAGDGVAGHEADEGEIAVEGVRVATQPREGVAEEVEGVQMLRVVLQTGAAQARLEGPSEPVGSGDGDGGFRGTTRPELRASE